MRGTSIAEFSNIFEFVQLDQNCPCNWKKFDGRCYYVGEKALSSWHAARNECRALGGDLAVPKSTENNRHIYEALKQRKVNRAWIGVYRGAGNKFYTVRDVEISYTNWSNGEPNNSGGEEDCAEIWYEKGVSNFDVEDGGWNDLPCSNYFRHFICQMFS